MARGRFFQKLGMDPSKVRDPCLCMSEDESVLMDDANIQLRVVEEMLLSRDMHAILHTKDSTTDIFEKICQNLVFVSISLLSLINCLESCTCCFGKLTYVVFCLGGYHDLQSLGKGRD